MKRKFLQPQPKKKRNRRKRPNIIIEIDNTTEENSVDENDDTWNGVLKNISGEEITEVEKSLFCKGKKFCQVELDPPILRMQKELNSFYRNLRLQWHFYGQEDGRSQLEKRFYPKSDWKPPKACVEIESYISRIQEKFDRWKPPKKMR